MLVQLPKGRLVVVDAKAPLIGYLGALEADSPERKKACLQQHARHIADHVRKLSRKDYWKQFETAPEFVVLFLPGEAFFSAALQADPQLIDLGAQQRVILATPTTLIALLRAVAYGWQQAAYQADAARVIELGKTLYQRVGVVGRHFEDMGKSLNKAVEKYNQTLSSLERNVLTTTRKLEKMESLDVDEIPEQSAVDTALRPITATELSADSEPPEQP